MIVFCKVMYCIVSMSVSKLFSIVEVGNVSRYVSNEHSTLNKVF